MRRFALVAAAGLALAGCGTTAKVNNGPPITLPRPHNPITVVHFPKVTPTERVALHGGAQIVSPTRLAITTIGSSSCPSVPDELTYIRVHAIQIHLTTGSWIHGKLVASAPPNGGCTLDLGTTPMLVALDPKEIDVHHRVAVRLLYRDSKTPVVRFAAPLKG